MLTEMLILKFIEVLELKCIDVYGKLYSDVDDEVGSDDYEKV